MDFIRFALLGLGTGALYAILAQGLVLIYRGSGILNFAHGAFVMVGAYTYYELNMVHAPFAVCIVAAAAGCALLGALTHLLIMRPMRRVSPLARVIATLGVMVVLESAAVLLYPGSTRSVPSELPTTPVHLGGGLTISEDKLIIFGVGVALTVVLWLGYRRTQFGRLTTAVAENPMAASSTGHSPDWIAAGNWALGAGLAGVVGVLIAPITFLQPSALVLLVVPALAAGLVGGFSSFPLAFAGGLALGVIESLVPNYITAQGWAPSVPFLILTLVLVIRGRSIPVRGLVIDRLPAVSTGRIRPIPLAIMTAAGLYLLAAVLPFQWVNAVTFTVLAAIICVSVVVVTGFAGQLSLAQYVIAGVAAVVAGRLAADLHWPFLAAALGAVLVSVLLGIVVGLPAVRTRGATLAIVTLGLAVVLVSLVLTSDTISGGDLGITVPPPELFGWSIDPTIHWSRYGCFCFACLVLVSLLVCNLRRGVAGRRLLAVRSNERAAAALGISVRTAKLYAFALGAGIAAIGGVLLGYLTAPILGDQFDVLSSVTFVGVTVAGGVGSVGGALVGSTLIPGGVVTQIFFGVQQVDAWLPLLGGIGLLLTLRFQPDGIWEASRRALAFISAGAGRYLPHRPATAKTPPAETAYRDKVVAVQPMALDVQSMSVRFGGLVAVDGVSIQIAPGQIHGLIGPNGAGKTTLIDAITGFVSPSSGAVLLDGVDLTRAAASRRARAGIARSFQSLELFADLTVAENLAVACDNGRLSRYARDLFYPGRFRLSSHADAALWAFDLEGARDRKPDSLSFGQRRLVAIARAVASRPSVLLLDEPAAGLDDHEAQELSLLIRTVAKSWGIGVLLVEHNVGVVMSLCDQVTVLDRGAVLASAKPHEIQRDPAVMMAYLGDSAPPVSDEPSRARS
jgi:ABC-type branched-subunit amino acid transport system ATPase component/branched-subunit amino acid ABC-type transport system permease component